MSSYYSDFHLFPLFFSVLGNPTFFLHEVIIKECGSTLYVGLQHVVPPTNTNFKLLLLQTQVGVPYRNTHKHRTSYIKSTLTFLGPAKRWKSNSTDRQKQEILVIFSLSISGSAVATI